MEKNKQQTDIITENFVSDIRTIIEQGRKQAYATTGQIAIMTYWNIGRRIVEEEQHGASRAAYGQKLIPALAVRLAAEAQLGILPKVLSGIQGCRDFAHACAKSYLVTCSQAPFRQQYASKGMVSENSRRGYVERGRP